MNSENPLSAGIGAFDNLADLGDTYELEHRAQKRAQLQASKLITDIADRATTVLYRSEIDTDTAADIAHTLHRKGFDPHPEGDESTVAVLLPPRKYHELEDSVDVVMRRPTGGVDETMVHGMQVTIDQHLPEDVGVAIHEDAIAPNSRVDSWRPFVVRYGEGIVRLEFHD